MARWFALVGVLLMPGSAFAQKGASPAKHGWQSSWEAARSEARKSGKPLFVVFRCEP